MLFFKECKKVLLSLTFVLYILAMAAMYFTQFNDDAKTKITPPQPGLSDYGMIEKEIPEILMPAAVESLISEYLSNKYVAYPIGWYKEVSLNKKDKNKMAEIISEVSGIPSEELNSFEDFKEGIYTIDDQGNPQYVEANIPDYSIPETLTYERFRKLMAEADDIIGGGSKYSDNYIIGNFSLVPKTYEDALEEYNKFLYDDKISGAYSRLFCDYLGIVLTILPVFVAVSFSSLDKKSRIKELIHSRKISSSRLIFTRYGALIFMMTLPVIILSIIAQVKVASLYSGSQIDNFAMLKNTITWLLPSIMTTTAVGMLLTEISSSMIAIFIQGVWWFLSFTSKTELTGKINKFSLILRHNSLYHSDTFKTEFSNFAFNRIFYTLLSLALITLTVLIYEEKRRGKFNELRIIKTNFKNKSKA